MKHAIISLALVAGLATTINAQAHEGSKHEGSKHEPTTITGEVVDTECYLGHEARGAKHAECAIKCINGGMPMGLLTSKCQLFLLTMNHDNPDPYNKLKKMAGKTVTVTGEVMERAGMKGIDVASSQSASTGAAK